MTKAYLIVDMSNDFVADEGGLTAGKPAQAIVPQILKRAEEFFLAKDLVVFCMDEHRENDPHFSLWPRHNVAGTWGAALYGELKDWYDAHKDAPNVLFLGKSEYDAFYQTPLEALLRENDVTEVYVAGVCTDICVFNTVYGAYKCGFPTFVSGGECATFTGNQTLFLNHMNAIYKTTIEE